MLPRSIHGNRQLFSMIRHAKRMTCGTGVSRFNRLHRGFDKALKQALDFLVQLGIFHRDRHLGGNTGQDFQILGCKHMRTLAGIHLYQPEHIILVE